MRPLAALALLALLAGCAAPPAPAPPSQGLAGWRLDCLGSPGWTDACTSRATTTNGPANENWLGVNPADPSNVVTGAKDYNDAASSCVWGGVTTSKDGARSWTEFYIGGALADRQDPGDPLFGYQCVTDPMFAFDGAGRLYYVIEAYGRTPHERPGLLPLPPGTLGPFDRTLQHPDTAGNTMFIAVSTDGGLTFGEPVRVWDGEGALLLLDDKTMILANPASGSIHFTTSQFAGGLASGATQILVFTSRDQGASWGSPVVVSAPEDASLKFPAALSAARDGTLYLSWHDWNTNRILFTRSTDDGASFEVPRAIASTTALFTNPPNAQYRVVTQPYHAVDTSGGPRDGSITMTWMQNVSGHMDVVWMRSADQGQTWTEPRALTDDDTPNDQFHPAIAVDDQGAVHVTYYDRRHDPANKLVDLSWAIAPDGSNFTSFRVTNSSFDGDLGIHQDGFPFLGDYNGLGCAASRGGGPGGPSAVCYASWADTRMGRGDIAVARLVRS